MPDDNALQQQRPSLHTHGFLQLLKNITHYEVVTDFIYHNTTDQKKNAWRIFKAFEHTCMASAASLGV
jgi:hypothetical protein